MAIEGALHAMISIVGELLLYDFCDNAIGERRMDTKTFAVLNFANAAAE